MYMMINLLSLNGVKVFMFILLTLLLHLHWSLEHFWDIKSSLFKTIKCVKQ